MNTLSPGKSAKIPAPGSVTVITGPAISIEEIISEIVQ